MLPSHLRRTAAVVAFAATAAATFVVAGTAVGADQQRTSISIRLAHHLVRPGGSDRVRGDLRVTGIGPASGKTVTLEARMAGDTSFTPIATAESGARGGVSVVVTPAVRTRYRWQYAGDATTGASHSGVVTVAVRTPQHPARRLPASLSVRLATPRVGLDGTDRIMGRLASHRFALRHKPILLLSKVAGASSWSFDRVRRTHADGRVAFTVRPGVVTRFRLVFLGSPNFRAARSGTVRVAPRPTALSITATPHRIDRGGSATVAGVLTDSGAPYAGQNVELRARTAGAHGFTTIDSATTGADGSVAFSVSPVRTTHYVLLLPHTTGVPAARSMARTVAVRSTSSLSIRGKATLNGHYVVRGDLRGQGHGLGHRLVTLQRQGFGETSWTDVRARRTDHAGAVRFTRALVAGTSYRLSYAGGPRFTGTTSGTVVS